MSVSVWDLSGQLVRQLRSGVHDPGRYTATFTAGDLPSGAYFVRLRTPEGVQSQQIVLAK